MVRVLWKFFLEQRRLFRSDESWKKFADKQRGDFRRFRDIVFGEK